MNRLAGLGGRKQPSNAMGVGPVLKPQWRVCALGDTHDSGMVASHR